MAVTDIPIIGVSLWSIVDAFNYLRHLVASRFQSASATVPTAVSNTPTSENSMSISAYFTDISIAMSLASQVPAFITFAEGELPTLKADAQSVIGGLVTGAKALETDFTAEFTKGQAASVEVANGEKFVADAGAFLTSLLGVLPAAKADLASEYAKFLPYRQPIATTFGKTLPTAVFAAPASPAAAATVAAAVSAPATV